MTDDSLPVIESCQFYLDPLSVRSSYPMAKRATEHLCHLYAKQHGVPVKIARLTQTTGAGIAKEDKRVIAQFTRLATQGRDIICTLQERLHAHIVIPQMPLPVFFTFC